MSHHFFVEFFDVVGAEPGPGPTAQREESNDLALTAPIWLCMPHSVPPTRQHLRFASFWLTHCVLLCARGTMLEASVCHPCQ